MGDSLTLIVPRAALRNAEAPPAEALILRTLRAEGIPLTLRQIRARTGMPLGELYRTIQTLCAERSVSRLNTIIESFCLGMQD